MKRTLFSLVTAFILIISFNGCGDTDIFSFVNKTVVVDKAGGLAAALSLTNLASINTLKISGKIDSRDFKTIRDHMKELKELDLSNATIEAYRGFEGTDGTEIYEYPANTIPVFAFYNHISGNSLTVLSKITFPQNLKAIGESAFVGCSGLSSLNLPSELKNIGNRSFTRCSGLTEKVIIPTKVDTIGYSAFAYCTSLTSVQFSDSLLFIGESAFNGCTALSGKLNLPAKLQAINDNAFQDCSGLTEINISGALSSLGNAVFQNCVCPINVSTDNPNLSSVDGVLFDFSQISLKYFPASKTGAYQIPSTVILIENAAFSNCKGLTSITLPTGVMSIGDYAFLNCSGLTGAMSIPNSVFAIGMFAFEGCSGLTALNVASDNSVFASVDGVLFDLALTTLYQYPPAKAGAYVIPESTTTINPGAFMDCSKLSAVTIPASVTIIGNRAFMNCTGLNSIRCNTSTPVSFVNEQIITSWSVFDNVNKSNCTLYIPAGSKTAYKQAEQWKDFLKITEI